MSDAKPTPPSGTPAIVAATSDARPSQRDEIVAPPSDPTARILTAIDALGQELRSEVAGLREESRARHRELAAADDTTKHEVRRLERRIDAVEEQLREERTARERETEARLGEQRAREDAKRELTDAINGFQRHAEQVAKASAEREEELAKREEAAVKRYEEAGEKMQGAVESFGALAKRVASVEEEHSEEREAQAARDRVQRALCAAMGIDYEAAAQPPPEDESEAKALAKKSAPKANLVDVARSNHKATFASGLTLAILLAEIVLRMLGKH